MQMDNKLCLDLGLNGGDPVFEQLVLFFATFDASISLTPFSYTFM